MGKRSSFERIPRDFYPTPREAVLPLIPHLPDGQKFIEPCVGDGTLRLHLSEFGCIPVFSSDLYATGEGDRFMDARAGKYAPDHDEVFITNPPWSRDVLHPIILNLSKQAPTWLLFDADWMHTLQSVPYMALCRKIVSVGRVKWIPGSPFTGKDNCCWYLFDANSEAPAQFIGRAA